MRPGAIEAAVTSIFRPKSKILPSIMEFRSFCNGTDPSKYLNLSSTLSDDDDGVPKVLLEAFSVLFVVLSVCGVFSVLFVLLVLLVI